MRVVNEDEGCGAGGSDSHAQMILNPGETSAVKVLGIPWDTERDILMFDVSKIAEKAKSEKMTKRKLLSASASLYDLFGAIAPVVFSLKTMFQRLCKNGGSWDDELGEEIKAEWDSWVESAEQCGLLELPRCYWPKSCWLR